MSDYDGDHFVLLKIIFAAFVLIVVVLGTILWGLGLIEYIKPTVVEAKQETVEYSSIIDQIEGIDLPIPLSEKEIQLHALKDEVLKISKSFEAREKALTERESSFKKKRVESKVNADMLTSQKLVKGLTIDEVLTIYGKPNRNSISAGHDWEERSWFYNHTKHPGQSNYLKFRDDKLIYWDLDFKFERKS
jgi:hypothetical protein